MSTVFTKIINGDIPSYKIAENEYCYAFLDIFPLQLGHCLVVPKIEFDQLYELDSTYFSELMNFSKQIARAMKLALPCNRIGSAVIGLEVPHAHIHLIPINNMDDMNFSNEKLNLSSEEFESIAKKIREQL